MAATATQGESIELLHQGVRSIVRRNGHSGESASFVSKTAANTSAERLRLLQHEWDLLNSLRGGPGVIQARALERASDQWSLLLEDTGGVSLERLALAHSLSVADVASIALGAVEALESVHRASIVHGELNPSHLLLSGPERRVTLIDFAHAWRAGSYPGRAMRPTSLAYISPEQTGRMNRAVDHRTDFYSLGVILYELLVGSVPFSQNEPMEIVHAHVARQPRDPSELTPAIPRALSKIILKLLAKEAEDRYHSAAGLRRDVLRCREQLQAGQHDFDFEIGSFDPPEQFRLPQRLYGRRGEISMARSSLDQAFRGEARVLTVAGPAGAGKSAVVSELAGTALERDGFYASGKFEQYESSVPYAAFSRALDGLVQQLLARSADHVRALTVRLTAALGSSGSALSDLCPSLQVLLGAQESAPQLPPREAQTRLQQALSSFFELVAGKEHPVVLVLDDVHRADADSSSLLQEFVLGSRQLPLLVVVAYRDDELGEQHALRATLNTLARQGIPVDRLTIGSLGQADLAHLIRDATSLRDEQATELAALVLSRTGGNPFFAREFLNALNAGGQLARNATGWYVDLDGARTRGITDNIVHLLVERIARLPAATQHALRVAACLGSRFDVQTLARISAPSLALDLAPAINAELVLPFHQSGSNAGTEPAPLQEGYQFTHDRIQQAVLFPLTAREQRELHRELGRNLLASCGIATRTRDVFQIVGHLNQAAELLNDAEQLELAQLNLEAALGALQRAAGAEALQLVRSGLSLIAHEPWASHYDLARDLHLVGAEAAFAVADYGTLETFAQTTLTKVRSPLEAIRVRRVQGLALYAQFRFAEALNIYLQILEELDLAIPAEPSPLEVAEELRATAEALRHRKVTDLLELPACETPRILSGLEVLSKIVLITATMSSPVFPLATCRLVRLSLVHGNSPESANGYTFYGQLLSRDHDLGRAYEFAKLALEVAHRFNDRAVLSQTYIYAYYQLMHWKLPFPEIIPGLRAALQYALEAGSPFNAACSATTLCIAKFWAGEPLGSLSDDLLKHRQVVVRFGQGLVLNWHEIWQQVVTNLRSDSTQPTQLSGPSYNEAERLKVHQAAGDASALFNYHVGKAVVCYVLGDYAVALRQMDDNQPWVELFATQFWAIPLAFMDSLCRLGACVSCDIEQRAALLARVERTLEKMRGWLPHNRALVDHKLSIIEAELAHARGDLRQAQPLFERAVAATRRAGVIYELALVCELAARCSAELGERTAERAYLRSAHHAYLEWGALTKVKALERAFPGLLPRIATNSVNLLALTGHEVDLDPLDLVSLIDAGQAIASEIKLEGLLRQLMRLLVENAGAQTAYLLMQKQGGWVIEAGQSVEHGLTTLLESIPFDAARSASLGIASSVVNYVTRTGETVLLDDASRSPPFARDPQLSDPRMGSLLCFALKRQGQVLAIAYLENRLARGAFTAKGVRLLEAISTQAVTSLENAMLYAQLEQKVEARTHELVQKNEELSRTLVNLTELREQLVVQEKLAALGALTAGIAHEIKNPLNFVANFAVSSANLVTEIRELLPSANHPSFHGGKLESLLDELLQAVNKVTEHAQRASGIVTGMALHARESGGPRELSDLNALLERTLQLTSETRRSGVSKVAVHAEYDAAVGLVEVVVQDISRVFVNILNNAFQAVEAKRTKLGSGFVPRVTTLTKSLGDHIEVRFRDNGMGIPRLSRERIFHPFFTTKAPRGGTGLGLSISHDIVVRAHGGDLRVESVENEFAEFILILPRRSRLASPHPLPAADRL